MDIIITLLPTLALVGFGYALKRAGKFDADFGRTLLKFVFVVPAPALALRAISQFHFDTSLIALMLLPVALTTASFLIAKPLENKLHLKPKQFAVFLMATMAVNSGFTLPFVVSLAGDTGAAQVVLFNVLNNVMVFGWVYGIAVAYGSKGRMSILAITKKVLLSPVLITIAVALLMNITHTPIPAWLVPGVDAFANLTTPLILLALGFILQPRLLFPKQTALSLAIRMLGGLAISLLFVALFHLTGIERITAIMLAASPVGFNAITFSSLEKLDDEFAASIVSMGLVAGLVFIPVIMLFLR